MIVSFVHNKKKKQLKIDKLESVLSIKNKINYLFFDESKKLEDIELFYNKNKLKNEDYCDKLNLKENEKIMIHLKTKGGGDLIYYLKYIVSIIIIFIPVFILPSAFNALCSNLLGEILVKIKNNLSKYLVCTLGLNTLNRRISFIINFIHTILFIMFTYVVITIPICVATFMAKGKTFKSKPKSLCSPLYVGTLTGLIFTSLYFLFYFLFRFSDKLLLPLIDYSKKNMLTNILVRPLLTLLYNIFNTIKFTIVYIMPFFGSGIKAYHMMIDSAIPPLFEVLNIISDIGCQDNFNLNKIKNTLNARFKKNNITKPNNNQDKTNQNKNTESKDVHITINNKLLNIQFNDGLIDSFGLDEQLNKMIKDLPNNISPICKEPSTSCCNVKMLKKIGDLLYDKIENPVIKNNLQEKGYYFGIALAIQGIYEKLMSNDSIDIDVSNLNDIEKKLKLKSISVNDTKFIDEKILKQINEVVNNPDTNEASIDEVYKDIYKYLHKDNLNNGEEKDEILRRISYLENEANTIAKKEGSDYQLGKNKTKDFIKNIVLDSICNIFESANAASSLPNELGGVNGLMDILKCASGSGGIIVFFYIITVIILIICGFLGIY